MINTEYIDVHCHPSLKPYSKSFKYQPTKQNSLDASRKNSIWKYSPPTVLEKFVNRMVTLTKFSQTDLTSLAKSKSRVVIISLYPFEKHFLSKNLLNWKGITDLLVNLAASISQKRIDYVRNHNNYFVDLVDEYSYYKQLHNQVQKVGDIWYTYRLVDSYDAIANNFQADTDLKKIINLVVSIEGGHALNSGLKMQEDSADETEVLANLKTIKSWEHRPLFITFAHHFYNELCGHARSISIGALKKNQDRGLNTGITPLGMKVLRSMLDNTNGNRILVDVKHMSTKSRATYYNLLDTEFAGENIPVIASHGAANGFRSIQQHTISDYPERAHLLNESDINFYDSEFIQIALSSGIIGLQLDARRIGSKKAIRKSKIYFPNKRKQLRKKAKLVWRQVEHIAEVLNNEGLFCWGIQTIGSDFDGIVNPINGLWTAENIKDLGEEMLNHANAYLGEHNAKLLPFNQIDAETIVVRVLRENAMEFIKRNY